jgi:hypothetical protein
VLDADSGKTDRYLNMIWDTLQFDFQDLQTYAEAGADINTAYADGSTLIMKAAH